MLPSSFEFQATKTLKEELALQNDHQNSTDACCLMSFVPMKMENLPKFSQIVLWRCELIGSKEL